MTLPDFFPPDDVELGRPFWDGIEQGELRVARCGGCGRLLWYPDDVGPCCPGAAYAWTAVSGEGTVHTFTRVHRPFLPDSSAAPYLVALVELDDAPGIRLAANLDDSVAWTIGDRVRVEFARDRARTRPVFVPAGGGPDGEPSPVVAAPSS